MIKQIAEIQNEIDQFKSQLNSVPSYVALSGAHALPITLKTEPYMTSMSTGIVSNADEDGYPEFEFVFKGHASRYRAEKKDERKVGGTSNTTLALSFIPGRQLGLLSEYTDQKINDTCEEFKQEQKVEEYILKKAERDFLQTSVEFFLKGD